MRIAKYVHYITNKTSMRIICVFNALNNALKFVSRSNQLRNITLKQNQPENSLISKQNLILKTYISTQKKKTKKKARKETQNPCLRVFSATFHA